MIRRFETRDGQECRVMQHHGNRKSRSSIHRRREGRYLDGWILDCGEMENEGTRCMDTGQKPLIIVDVDDDADSRG